MQYVILVLAAIAHAVFLHLGDVHVDLEGLFTGLAFASVWAGGLVVGEFYNAKSKSTH